MNAQPSQQPEAAESATETNSTTVAYQKFARLLMSTSGGASSIKDAEDIWTILHKIIIECSRANVEAGKTWITHHCKQESQLEGLVDLMIALVKNTTTFHDKLHIIYLVNDLLARGSRKQERWIIDVLYPKLVPLLRLAYHCPQGNQQDQQKVLKVIGIWKERKYFDLPIITLIQNAVVMPIYAASPPQALPVSNQSEAANSNGPQTSIPMYREEQKSYFELPVGPMIDLAKLDDTPYKAIKQKDISVPSRPLPTQELKQAMNVYYDGLALEDDAKFDAEGWENGFLDDYIGRVQAAKTKAEELQAQRKRVEESRQSLRVRDQRSASPHNSYRTGAERNRGRSLKRSRSRSRGRRRSSSQSRHRRKRSRSLERSRSRSESTTPPRRRQRSRSRTPPRSHIRSPPAQFIRGTGYSTVPGQRFRQANQAQHFQQPADDWDTPRVGLGAGNGGGGGGDHDGFVQATQSNTPLHGSGDVFDTYRRNRSYTYNRDSGRRSEPPVCFKCHQPGHLARDCSSLAAPY